MNRIIYIITSVLVVAISSCSENRAKNAEQIDKLPEIWPDYTEVTIPVNIAPMEFDMKDYAYTDLDVLFKGEKEGEINAYGKEGIDIDEDEWKELLYKNKDKSLIVIVSAKKDDKWVSFKPFKIYVKSDSIDYGIVYRLIAPGYQVYSKMGIYQRSLSDFRQSAIFENTQVTKSCVNCHTFCKGDPNIQSIHIRGKNGATIIVNGNKMEAINTKTDSTISSAVYPYWHPSGRYIAYSTNIVQQLFHTTSKNLMESFELNSDIYIYDTQRNEIIYNSATQNKEFFESNPAFSADGTKLYFCRSAKVDMPVQVKEARYDLCSVNFNPTTGDLSTEIDTVICVTKDKKSISLPRPSYDGKYIIYALEDYGCFPLYHKEADLWIYDIKSGSTRRMDEINSDFSDAFHNWSSNNHWIVFGSRRDDGMHTRAYFSYIDKNGVGRKPFLLPQNSPKEYYNNLMLSYNCLEFVLGKVTFNAREAGIMLTKEYRKKVNIRNKKQQ